MSKNRQTKSDLQTKHMQKPVKPEINNKKRLGLTTARTNCSLTISNQSKNQKELNSLISMWKMENENLTGVRRTKRYTLMTVHAVLPSSFRTIGALLKTFENKLVPQSDSLLNHRFNIPQFSTGIRRQ